MALSLTTPLEALGGAGVEEASGVSVGVGGGAVVLLTMEGDRGPTGDIVDSESLELDGADVEASGSVVEGGEEVLGEVGGVVRTRGLVGGGGEEVS